MKNLTITIIFSIFATYVQAQENAKVLDRYTLLSNIETHAQANPLNVVVSVKFAKSIITVKQAIEKLLEQSGFTLNNNYEAEKINNFKLPFVHREIGPISLKRAIKVLIGSAWNIQVDEVSRSIQVVQTGANTLQVLSPDARTMIESVIEPDVLDEVVAVSISDELIIEAFEKILPNGWKVRLENEVFEQKMISIVSEDLTREQIIKQVLNSVNSQGYFYKKLKLLVIRDNTKVIK
jgi:type IV pili sensor histidine kinase/response regulator